MTIIGSEICISGFLISHRLPKNGESVWSALWRCAKEAARRVVSALEGGAASSSLFSSHRRAPTVFCSHPWLFSEFRGVSMSVEVDEASDFLSSESAEGLLELLVRI